MCSIVIVVVIVSTPPPPEEEVAAIDFLRKLPLVCQVSLQAEDDLKLPDLLKISPNILSYPLADCCEFRACMAVRCLCSQNIIKY